MRVGACFLLTAAAADAAYALGHLALRKMDHHLRDTRYSYAARVWYSYAAWVWSSTRPAQDALHCPTHSRTVRQIIIKPAADHQKQCAAMQLKQWTNNPAAAHLEVAQHPHSTSVSEQLHVRLAKHLHNTMRVPGAVHSRQAGNGNGRPSRSGAEFACILPCPSHAILLTLRFWARPGLIDWHHQEDDKNLKETPAWRSQADQRLGGADCKEVTQSACCDSEVGQGCNSQRAA